MNAQKTVQPFLFSARSRAALDAMFEGHLRAKAFIGAAQKIVANHISVTNDFSELPAASTLRANARAIAAAARVLSDCMSCLTGEEAELMGQFMWITDKINYYPGASSVERSAQTIFVIREAAQKLAHSGKEGRPGLRLNGLIRELHASYVSHFKMRPVISVARGNKFAAALRICLAEAGVSRPAKFLNLMRDALGEDRLA